MVVKLIVVWAVAVVAFFALWAVLAKVVKRISERKNEEHTFTAQDAPDEHSGQNCD